MKKFSELSLISGGRTRYQMTIEIDRHTTNDDIEVFAMLLSNSSSNIKYQNRVAALRELRDIATETRTTQFFSVNRDFILRV